LLGGKNKIIKIRDVSARENEFNGNASECVDYLIDKHGLKK
jgi:hypothetical protein